MLRMPIGTRTTDFIRIATGEHTLITERVNRLVHRVNRRMVQLREGVDFDITDDGAIDWRKGDRRGTAPAPDVVLCANYYIRPRYVVTSLAPYGIRVTQTQLGFSSPTPILLPFAVTARLDVNLHRPGGAAVLPSGGAGE